MNNPYRITVGLLVAASIVTGLYFYYPHSPGGSQQNNMAIAEQCSLNITKPVRQQARFAGINRPRVYTGNGGSLLIPGKVSSETDLVDLKTLAASICPNTNFTWDVDVESSTTESE